MARKNLEKLVMTRALVKEERRAGKWDQGSWTRGLVRGEDGYFEPTCGTTACVAGWAVIVDGGKFLGNEFVKARKDDDPSNVYVDYFDSVEQEAKYVTVSARARSLLGLTRYEASDLFAGTNSYADVKRLLKQYIKEARAERRGGVQDG